MLILEQYEHNALGLLTRSELAMDCVVFNVYDLVITKVPV